MKAGENLAGIHSTPLISIFTFFVQMPQPVFLSSLSINAMCTTNRELSFQSTVRAGLCRYMYFQQTLGTSSPLLSSRSTRVCVAIARADGWLGSRVSAPDKPLYVSARAPAAKPLTSSADLFAAGKRVLLVDVRTEEEMRVSMLRGAVTRQDITQPYRAS